MERAGVDVLLLTKGLRGTRNQCLNVVDNLADVIGNSSSGVGRVRTALKSDNLQFWSAPTRLRGRAHTCRIAANDDESLCSYGVFLSLQRLFMIIRYGSITVC
jgi:hypothetical protein